MNDQKIKIPRMGHASDVYTSFAGDLLLVIKVKKHEFFERVGEKDIETEVPLNLVEAIRGAKITIQTIDGPLTIVTKPGVCTGDTMRLKHFGAHEFNPPDAYDPQTLRGDHIVKFNVILPEFDPDSQSEKDRLLKRLLDLDEENQEEYYKSY